MSAALDWSSLGHNPAAGSPEAIRSQAQAWRRAAGSLGGTVAAVEGIRARALPAAWRDSAGADQLGNLLAAQSTPMLTAGRLLQQGALALDRYAEELAGFQHRAAAMLLAADGATARLAEANTAAQQVRLARFAPRPVLTPGNESHWDSVSAAAQARVDAAAADLRTANSQALLLRAEMTSAAIGCAAELDSLRRQLTDLPRPRTVIAGTGSAAGSFVGSGGYAATLDAIAKSGPPVLPSSAAEVTRSWSALDPRLRELYLRLYPALIGNTAGIPARDRDRANRIANAEGVARIRAEAAAKGVRLPPADQDPAAAKDAYTRALQQLGYDPARIDSARASFAVEYQLRTSSRPLLQLIGYEPAAFGGRGRAMIAVGDIATARNVAVVIPGMTAQVPDYLDNQLANAVNLHTMSTRRGAGSTAVVAYLGYEAPDLDGTVTNTAKAEVGAVQVAADLQMLSGLRDDPAGSRFTVIAHSYGSTTAAIAFSRHRVQADALVLIGSPGAGTARTAAELGLAPGRVFVGAASSDPVTTRAQQLQDPKQAAAAGAAAGMQAGVKYGREHAGELAVLGLVGGYLAGGKASEILRPNLGVDPAGRPFGATRFHAENTDKDSLNFDNHSNYLRTGTESGENVADIVAGRYESVTLAPARPGEGDHYSGTDPETGHLPVPR